MGAHPVTIFDRGGRFTSSWGEGEFRTAHSIYVDRDDFVYTVDCGTHLVVKHAQSGEPVLTLGNRDLAGAVYYGEVFNMPTGVAVSSTGHIFVSDGYGNFKVQKFSPEGKHLGNWGRQGKGPGEFALVHNIDIDKNDLVYVCDRENGRIEIFDGDGTYLREWGGMKLPCSIDIDGDVAYICEQAYGDDPARVHVLSLSGDVVSSWSTLEEEAKGSLGVAHGIAVDSRGDIYVADNPNAYQSERKGQEWTARVVKFIRQ